MAVYSKIKQLVNSGRKAALISVVSAGNNPSLANRKIIISEDRVVQSGLTDELTKRVVAAAAPFLKKEQSTIIELSPGYEGIEKIFFHCFNPSPRLVIFGGGYVGAALCRLASQLDYEITVVDDRPSFAAQDIHPEADNLICESFEQAFDQIAPGSSDYIVIVTRGHRHDRLCLEKALTRDAAYIGMIGSRRKVKAQLQNMAAAGFTEEQLAAVHSPIGLPIGAVTEAEIALSILAEITKVRRTSSSGEAFQEKVLQELERLEEVDGKAVLATIITAQGSTPRKPGAQMIIFPDGTLKGTIGGGCAEAEVRREAMHCLDSGRSGFIRLNLTADAAAEEGMVCGGLMDIYLEFLPSG